MEKVAFLSFNLNISTSKTTKIYQRKNIVSYPIAVFLGEIVHHTLQEINIPIVDHAECYMAYSELDYEVI